MPQWAAIFDWDGVIIDSSRPHLESWELAAKELGFTLPPDHFKRSFGMKSNRIIPEILGWATAPEEIKRISDRKETLYRELIRKNGIEPLPGVAAWLEQLRVASIRCAIASSTERANIDCALSVIGIRDYFDAIVAGDDVTHGKPDPEVFLVAAQKIGWPPARCVVFEDAQVGIEAARAAAMKVVGVGSAHTAASLKNANMIVERLDRLSVEKLNTWFPKSNVP